MKAEVWWGECVEPCLHPCPHPCLPVPLQRGQVPLASGSTAWGSRRAGPLQKRRLGITLPGEFAHRRCWEVGILPGFAITAVKAGCKRDFRAVPDTLGVASLNHRTPNVWGCCKPALAVGGIFPRQGEAGPQRPRGSSEGGRGTFPDAALG